MPSAALLFCLCLTTIVALQIFESILSLSLSLGLSVLME
jgi:hypothetical protein